MGGIQDSKWGGFQWTALEKVAKGICESFTISYLREFEGRETEVSVKSGRLENSKYKFSPPFFFFSEWGKCRTGQNQSKKILWKSIE